MDISATSQPALTALNTNKDSIPPALGADQEFAQTLQATIDKNNAPILAKRRQAEKEMELQEKRILEVGFAEYIREQQEVKKLLNILHIIKDKASKQVKELLGKVIDHFEDTPPANINEMYEFMQGYVDSMPEDASKLKQQMKELLLQIYDMMELSDEELNALRA